MVQSRSASRGVSQQKSRQESWLFRAFFFNRRPLSKQARASLASYAYRGINHSLLMRYFLGPLYGRLVQFVPMNIAYVGLTCG